MARKKRMGKVILGLTEKVTLLSPSGTKLQVVARIDTGATSSSLDARLVEKLQLGPVITTRLVKSASGVKRRPLLNVSFILHGQSWETNFTIADREHMTYPVLLGQNILQKGHFLIDPRKSVHHLKKEHGPKGAPLSKEVNA